MFLIKLLVSCSSILAFRYFFFVFLKCLQASHLTRFNYLNCYGLDRVTTALHPASFDLKIVNILHQTIVYAASIHRGLRLSVAEVLK